MAGVTIGYKGSTIATIQGTGSKTLLTEGKYCEGDISVNYVKEGITPSGTKSITANGTVDVTNYASAAVNVAANVTTKNITANGTYNASSDNADGYSQVNVAIPSKSVIAIVTITSAKGNQDVTLISGNQYIKDHYNDSNAFALVVRTTNVDDTNGGINLFFNSNKVFGATTNGGSSYVYGYYANRANSGNTTNNVNRVISSLSTDTTSVLTLRANSSGNLILKPAGQMSALREGVYFVVFGLMEDPNA